MTDHDLEQRLRAWYRADIDDYEGAPAQLRTDLATLAQPAGSKRRPWTAGWGFPPMNRFAPIALAATAVVVAILIGIGLITRSPNVGPPSVPIATPYPTAHAQNGWIAVSANPINVRGGEDGDIYLVAEGAAARRIIGSDGDGVAQACPRFSPDGRRLAYGEARASAQPVTTFRGGWPVSDRAVVVVGLNGHGDASAPIMRVALPTDPGQIACPEWSPSGTQVAFRVGPELWVADAISGKTTVFPVTEEQGVAWSRDGSLIAVAEPGRIRVVRMDGGASTLIPVRGGTPGSLGWTAGDDRIIYVSPDDPPQSNRRPVHAVGVNGSNDTQLTPDSTDPGVDFSSNYAVVSPDGTRVAYVQAAYRCTTDGCTTQPIRVLTMGTNGSNLVEMQTPPDFGGSGLQWSPDGKRLLSGVASVAVAPGSPAVVYARDGELNLEWSGWEFTWQPVFPRPTSRLIVGADLSRILPPADLDIGTGSPYPAVSGDAALSVLLPEGSAGFPRTGFVDARVTNHGFDGGYQAWSALFETAAEAQGGFDFLATKLDVKSTHGWRLERSSVNSLGLGDESVLYYGTTYDLRNVGVYLWRVNNVVLAVFQWNYEGTKLRDVAEGMDARAH